MVMTHIAMVDARVRASKNSDDRRACNGKRPDVPLITSPATPVLHGALRNSRLSRGVLYAAGRRKIERFRPLNQVANVAVRCIAHAERLRRVTPLLASYAVTVMVELAAIAGAAA